MKAVVEKKGSLLESLVDLAPQSSKNSLRSWIESGRIEVAGVVVRKASQIVYPGQEIVLGRKKQFLKDDIEILYEDSHLVVLYKPSGVLSVATDFDARYNVHTYLKQRFKGRRVYPVHRLDREASGVMVFAYTKTAQEKLKDQFEEHAILREYVAVIEGALEQESGSWQSYLSEDSQYRVQSVSKEFGQLATTHYEIIQKKVATTTIKVTLETGKKNQIRVHCKEAGHPIVGDKKYGAQTDPLDRLALHAVKLGFIHPTLEKTMVFERAPDKAFSRYLPQKTKGKNNSRDHKGSPRNKIYDKPKPRVPGGWNRSFEA